MTYFALIGYTLFNWVSCIADRRRQLSCVGEGVCSDATQLNSTSSSVELCRYKRAFSLTYGQPYTVSVYAALQNQHIVTLSTSNLAFIFLVLGLYCLCFFYTWLHSLRNKSSSLVQNYVLIEHMW